MSLSINIGRPFLNDKTLDEQARSVLRLYGTNAHVYLPGANGVAVSGLPTNNYTLSDGSTGYSAVDGTAGRVLDAAGSVGGVLKGAAAPLTGTTGFAGGQATLSFASGEVTITQTSGAYGQCSLNPPLVPEIGKTYRVEATFRRGTHSSVLLQVQRGAAGGYAAIVSTGALTNTTNVTKELYFTATATDCIINVTGSGTTGDTSFVSALSVSEVTGIHVTQATTANKPALRRGLYNLLLNSATPATQSVTCAASPYTLALYGTGSVTLSGTGSGTLNGTGASDLVVLNFTPTAGSVTFTKSGTVSSFGLFQGTLTAAQILAEGGIPLTTSAAASNQSAGRYWLGSDSSDSLQLGSVPFQYADDWFICAGAACNNKAVYPGVFESLGGTARIYSYFDAEGITVTQFKDDAGTSTYIVGPAFSDGASVVLSSYKQSGQVCTGLNGTDGTPQAAPAGTFTLSSSKLLNGLDGKLAAVVIIKGQVSSADRLTIERWVASLTPNGPSF